MAKTILSPNQQLLLKFLSEEQVISVNFYLSGGTALSEYYLHHRLSEDLDFFSIEEIPSSVIQTIFKKIRNQVNIQKVDFQESFNRKLFFIHLKGEVIKTEFTYYPFAQLAKPKLVGKLKVDSLLDIAVNKVFTIYQNPRSRDYIDLYLILTTQKWNFEDLIKKARLKFDSYIDPIQLAQNLLKVNDVYDLPKMLIPVKEDAWRIFWLIQAGKLKDQALKA